MSQSFEKEKVDFMVSEAKQDLDNVEMPMDVDSVVVSQIKRDLGKTRIRVENRKGKKACLETKPVLCEISPNKKDRNQKTILDYGMGFRTKTRSSSTGSLESLDYYETKKRKIKKAKTDMVKTLEKVVEGKEEVENALVIVEEGQRSSEGILKTYSMIQ